MRRWSEVDSPPPLFLTYLRIEFEQQKSCEGLLLYLCVYLHKYVCSIFFIPYPTVSGRLFFLKIPMAMSFGFPSFRYWPLSL